MSYSKPSDIAKDFDKSAAEKVAVPAIKMVVYSVLGGAFISIGGLLAIVIAGGMPQVAATNPGIAKFLFGAVFPVGLIMIVIGGAQLFTSDCAVIPFGFFNRKYNIAKVLELWTIVYLSNFVGALLIAYLFAYQAELLAIDPWKSFTTKLAYAKTSAPFVKTFIKAIGANWLVCLAVWMSYAAKDVIGKIMAIWIPVMCFVALGFEHSIANMFFIPAAMLIGADISVYDFLITNLVPATLGNIVGGVVMVALVYWHMFSTAKENMTKTKSVAGTTISTFKDFEKSLN